MVDPLPESLEVDPSRRARTPFAILVAVAVAGLVVALGLTVPDRLHHARPDARLLQTVSEGALTPYATAQNRDLARCTPGDSELASCGTAPALEDTQRWFNTPHGAPLTLAGLHGRVVLIDFFAYSCVNCRRDAPYVEKWATTYAASGLQVIGVHSPEFGFERSARNLRHAIDEEHLTYPVVQDNDGTTFRSYRNAYWPAKYLVDATGTVRAITFGEGGYDRTETLIRTLLVQRDPSVELPAPVTDVSIDPAPADTTPEAYLSGYVKTGYVGGALDPGAGQTLTLPDDQPEDSYSLGGVWDIGTESDTATDGSSQVRLHYRATQVDNVLAGEGTVTVSRPGRPDQVIEVSGPPDLHTLIQNDASTDETVLLTYSPGVEVYTFSFG